MKKYCIICKKTLGKYAKQNKSKRCRSCETKRKHRLGIINVRLNNLKHGRYSKYISHRCVDCHKKITIAAIRCNSCSNKRKWKLGLLCSSRTKPIGYVYTDKNGYEHIKIGIHNWKLKHRIVVEKWIGKKLDSKWIVHHIDGNKTNNNLKNLYIFISHKYHYHFESLLRQHILKSNVLKSNLNQFKGGRL